MAHGSDSLSSSSDGLDVQSAIPARLECKVKRWARGESMHPNAVCIWSPNVVPHDHSAAVNSGMDIVLTVLIVTEDKIR